VPDAPGFEYDRAVPPDIREVGQREQEGVLERLFTYATPFGTRRAAELIRPSAGGDQAAAILYVHWFEPESPNSNRTQFHDEAMQMARRGAACLLVETMWSDRDWFIKRTQADDYDVSIRQAIELRQALDLLLAQPGVDAHRCAYVGHDFGGMYGVLAGSADGRPTHYVIMAATPRFPEWFLYYPRLEGQARERFVERLAPLDPIANVAKLAPAPILFQFARTDPHVPIERAEDFYAAAAEPKEILWYETGHGLNADATRDRIAWLAERLGLAGDAE
jgi:dienelactone hydrolase